MNRHPLIGTHWGGASGAVATVETVQGFVVLGRWDSGALWSEHLYWLEKLYKDLDGMVAQPQ